MKDLKIYLIIAFSLLAFYLVAQYNQPRPINWTPTFDRTDKIPFGTYILYNRLKDIFPNAIIRPKRDAPFTILSEEVTHPGNYIIISQRINVDGFDFREFRKYMYRGNNIFIAGFLLNTYFTDSLKLKVSSERKFNIDAKIPISFVSPALNPDKKYTFDKGIGDQYFSNYDTAKAVILGVNNKGHANFIKYQYGSGALYLMASPVFFTNYNLLQPNGAEYVAKALSYLPPKQEIIWDEFSALGPGEDDQSPLHVILRYKELKWAYFITLFSMIAFVLYEIKRRQRIIPIIEPLKNSSAEFAKVVGQVYYQQRDNLNIGKKKVVYLLEEIRTKYAVKTTSLNQEFVDHLTAKSGVKADLINELIEQINQINKSNKISDQQLIALNKNIEQFHSQSK